MTYQETSAIAWENHNPGPINALILDAIRECPGELTCDDLEVLLDLDHQTASGNIAHMRNGTQGSWVFIEPTGEKGRTRANRRADKLRLVDSPRPPGSIVRKQRASKVFKPKPSKAFDEGTVLWDILTALGENPSTCEELELLLDRSHSVVSARLRDLALENRIVDSGESRDTKTGNPAIVWAITQ